MESYVQREPIVDNENKRVHRKTGNKLMRPTAQQTKKSNFWLILNLIIHPVCAFCLFSIVAMIIGIIVVYYTVAKPTVQKCELNFSRTDPYPINYKYGPRSITMGDFNNDTWFDMVIANTAVHSITVTFGYKDVTFGRPMIYSTGFGSTPYMVLANDINNDHRLDIVVANFGSNNVGIFLGFGNGSFGDQKKLSTGSSRPISINIADFNNDTFLDIVTANYGTHSISIFYGRGDGTFSKSVTCSTGYDSLPLSLASGDFNNDHYMDIAIVNYGTNTLGILFGNRNGTFENQIIFSTGVNSHPFSITVGFINNDAFLDIIVANYGTRNIGVFLGNGNKTFTSQVIYALDNVAPYSVDIGDFNQDNKMDLVVSNQNHNNIGVLLGSNNGTFASEIKYYSTGSSSSIMVTTVDLNKDNRLDIAVVNNDTGAIDILLGYFEGFANQTTFSSDSSLPSIPVGDFNKDGLLDIVVANALTNTVGVLLGCGNGSFLAEINYSAGAIPQSVAVGDFNKDTLLDIAVAYSDNNIVVVLFGYGNGSFGNPIEYHTGPTPRSVTVGDFNNDSYLDIVVVNNDGNTISILLGYDNGSFADQKEYYAGSNQDFVTVGDFNNDFYLDIMVNTLLTEFLGVLLGYGNGSFTDPIMYSTGSPSKYVAVGDFNKDSYLDIVATYSFSNNMDIFLGYGNGSFVKHITYATGSGPISVTVDDFNNDSRLDIAVTNGVSNTVGIYLGYGNGSFENERTYPAGSFPGSTAVADFNNDSRLDIIFVDSLSHNIGVLLQYNRGALIKHISYASGGASVLQHIAVSDVNNDTRLDIIVANYGTDNVGVLFGLGNGIFQTQIMLTTKSNSHPSSIAIADYNGDMYKDIAVINYGTKDVDLMLGNDNGTFIIQKSNEFHFEMPPFVIAAGDFNNDRRSEIVVAYDDSDDVDIFLAYNNRSFMSQIPYSVGPNSFFGGVGDFNNDSHLDIAVTSDKTNHVGILLGYGNGSFADYITYSTNLGSSPYFIGVSDFNNDSRLDIVVTYSGTNNVGILLGYGNGTFADPIVYATGDYPCFVVASDFNNDSRLDIVIVNNRNNTVSVFLGHGNGSFANQTTYSTGFFPQSAAVGDFNNDSRLDIVVANSNSLYISVLFGYGNGSFADQITYSTDDRPHSVAAGDFNNDSCLDIVFANGNFNSQNVGILLGYGNGSFADPITYPTDNVPQYPIVGDFNNDSCLDIVIVNYASNTLGILLGYGNGSFANQTTYSTGVYPFSAVVGDFNKDSRLDIVVLYPFNNYISVFLGSSNEVFVPQTRLTTGNYSRPRSLVIADLNNDNRMDIVVADSGTHTIGIFIGYGNISFAKQVIYSTGLYSSPYSVAVADFNNDNRSDIVVANYHTDNVGIFFGFGNGSFTNRTLYSTGSGSHPYYVAVADFNNDSVLDILVTNFDSNNQGVFVGHGDGTFAKFLIVATNYGSHPFFVVVGDFNGDRKTDFAVINNGTDSLNIFLQTC